MDEAATPAPACPSCGSPYLPGARFCSSCGSQLDAGSPVEIRKTVTVLFCDATSSTALGEQLDPESVRGLMTRYFSAMREVIEFHGGTVEKFIGDAVMAVFGVPSVHEDDALRACRAAVEIRERLRGLDDELRAERGASIEWRIGINTGEVVAGQMTGQRLVTGDPVNVAARLESAATPGETLLGESTYALVRGAVVAEPVEHLTLKGKAQPVPAWRLLAIGDEAGRRERPLGAPLVGRRRPMRLLDEAFQEAVEERACHLFTILGVAGVGKSRLVDEFVAGVAGNARLAVGRCLAYGRGITYWPVAEALRQALDAGQDAGPEYVDERLRDLLGSAADGDRIAGTVRGVLGIGEATGTSEEMFWALRKTFEAIARNQPLILVFDDAHWGEDSFLEFVDHLADWTRDAPILLIVVARPELLERRSGWGGGKRWVTTTTLEPLSADETEELLLALLRQTDLQPALRDQIRSASEGNPLFVEELLAKLIDDGFLVPSAGAWTVCDAPPALIIPGTIQALLAARLDGLNSEDRAVIERAAVEGQVFHRGAVIELVPEPEQASVPQRIASLMRMELVRPDSPSFAGDEAYRFRHLLIRDAAYQALAKQTRSDLHLRLASWLERVAADRQIEFQVILAYHLEQAYRYRMELGLVDDATRALGLRTGALLADAGMSAASRGDSSATVDLLERAIELLPDERARERRLAVHLGEALYFIGEAGRAERLLEREVAEARAVGDQAARALASVQLLLVRSSIHSVSLEEQVAEFQRLSAELEATGDTGGGRLARASAGWGLFGLGKASEALAIARDLLAAGPSGEAWYLFARQLQGACLVFGPTPADEAIQRIADEIDASQGTLLAVAPYLGIGRLRAIQGRFADAAAAAATARDGLQELGNRHLLASVADVEAEAAFLAGDLESASRFAEEAYLAMLETGDKTYASTKAVSVAKILVERDDVGGAERFARIAIDTSASDDTASQAGGRSILAVVASLRGDHDAAIALARDAEAAWSATDYLVDHGQVTQNLARVLHAAGDREGMVAAAQAARVLFERKGAQGYVDRLDRHLAGWDAGSAAIR